MKRLSTEGYQSQRHPRVGKGTQMSLDLNTLVIGGNLTADPELKTLPSGTTVCQFRIASNGGRDKDGNDYPACFIDVKVWNGQGENCAKYLAKGRSVTVKGRLTFESWDRQDGSRATKHVVTADRFGGVFFGAIPQGRTEEPAEEPVPVMAGGGAGFPDDDIPF